MSRRLVLTLLSLLPALATAQVPAKLGYQGRLLKADGTPESGIVALTFSVFTDATGDALLWTEVQTIALTDGFYATVLGEVTPLPASVFDGHERFLELAVAGAPLTPRQHVVSVPYALQAGSCREVAGGGTVDASSVRVNGVTVIDSSGRLAGPASYSPGSGLAISAATISLAPCPSGQILRTDGTAWACSEASVPTFSGRVVEGERTDAVAPPGKEAITGTNAPDATALGGQVRWGSASAASGTLFAAFPTTPGVNGLLGVGTTRASFRLKVANVSVTSQVGTVTCGATRGDATVSLASRILKPTDFPANLTWKTVSLYCDFLPDDAQQWVAVEFVQGATDLSLDFVQLEAVSGAGVPSGSVVMFNGAACPEGWSEVVAARGRTLVGLPAGGTVAGIAGSAFSNLENRPHNHDDSHDHYNNHNHYNEHQHSMNHRHSMTAHAHTQSDHNHYLAFSSAPTNVYANYGTISTGVTNTGAFVTDTTSTENQSQYHNHWVSGYTNAANAGTTSSAVTITGYMYESGYTGNQSSGGYTSNYSGNTSVRYGGTGATNNLVPYVQLLVCQKD